MPQPIHSQWRFDDFASDIRMRPFIAFIRKHSNQGFRVSFPDLPDCNSSGETIIEARENAERALAVHCQALKELGEAVPPPSYMHQITWSRERATDGLVALIPSPEQA
jgi:predicted RNase H-like HicB family nuclease